MRRASEPALVRPLLLRQLPSPGRAAVPLGITVGPDDHGQPPSVPLAAVAGRRSPSAHFSVAGRAAALLLLPLALTLLLVEPLGCFSQLPQERGHNGGGSGGRGGSQVQR